MSKDLKPGCPVRGVFGECELLRTPRDGLMIRWGSSAFTVGLFAGLLCVLGFFKHLWLLPTKWQWCNPLTPH